MQPATRAHQKFLAMSSGKNYAPETTFSLWEGNGKPSSLGLHFGRGWKVDRLDIGKQADLKGVQVGWKLLEFENEPVNGNQGRSLSRTFTGTGSTFDLRNALDEARADNKQTITLRWQTPAEEGNPEPGADTNLLSSSSSASSSADGSRNHSKESTTKRRTSKPLALEDIVQADDGHQPAWRSPQRRSSGGRRRTSSNVTGNVAMAMAPQEGGEDGERRRPLSPRKQAQSGTLLDPEHRKSRKIDTGMFGERLLLLPMEVDEVDEDENDRQLLQRSFWVDPKEQQVLPLDVAESTSYQYTSKRRTLALAIEDRNRFAPPTEGLVESARGSITSGVLSPRSNMGYSATDHGPFPLVIRTTGEDETPPRSEPSSCDPDESDGNDAGALGEDPGRRQNKPIHLALKDKTDACGSQGEAIFEV
ncbi:unnamed protein product [Amoebophrya sp. A120]|nr:unnamed protein product [Amoebophrya sp. A120]|eukprot:GSA120T00015045001.1